jgi:hypothetical protein
MLLQITASPGSELVQLYIEIIFRDIVEVRNPKLKLFEIKVFKLVSCVCVAYLSLFEPFSQVLTCSSLLYQRK